VSEAIKAAKQAAPLPKQKYVHETVNHMEEYVRGNVHTQSIENACRENMALSF
jgi:hypothetical protein